MAKTFGRGGITAAMAATGARARGEGVSRIEAQEVVIGVAEEM